MTTDQHGASVVAVAMQKGGVGKTTMTIHLARGAHLAGLRTLVVDLDPQSNATTGLAPEIPTDDEVSIADVLDPGPGGNVPIDSVILPTIWSGVDLAPSITVPLTNVEVSIAAKQLGSTRRMAKAIKSIRDEYDLIIIDCPPALSLLTINALVAADKVLVVIQPEQWSLDGLAMLRGTVEEVQEHDNPNLEWAGVIINGWRGTTGNKEVIEELSENFTEAEVFGYRIPLWAGIGDSIAAQRGLDEWPGIRFRLLAAQFKQWATDLRE